MALSLNGNIQKPLFQPPVGMSRNPSQDFTPATNMSISPNMSTLYGPARYNPSTQKYNTNQSLSTLGLNTDVYGPQNNNNSGGGNGGGNGGGVPQAPQTSEVDSLYSSVIDRLGEQESGLPGQYDPLRQETNQFYDAQKAQLDTAQQQNLGQLSTAEQSAEARQQDAMAAARQLYNELMRQGQQRFGGATSAGQAYTELANVEQQKRTADINSQYEGAMQQIQTQRTQIQSDYQNQLLTLESQRTSALNELQRQLQQQLDEIKNNRAMIDQEKASQNLQRLQEYRNNVFSINYNAAQARSQMDSQMNQAARELEQAQQYWNQMGQTGQQAANDFSSSVTTNPQTELQVNTNQNNGGQNWVGAIGGGKDDWLGNFQSNMM